MNGFRLLILLFLISYIVNYVEVLLTDMKIGRFETFFCKLYTPFLQIEGHNILFQSSTSANE